MAADMPEIIEPDEQDQTEVFDETHLDDETAEFLTLEEAPDVFDVTQALGDGRDIRAFDAADLDPKALDDEDLETDEDVDDNLDDDLEDEEEDDEIDEEEDPDDEDGVTELEWDEAEIETVADVDLETDSDEEEDDDEFESEELSDEELRELGYIDEPDEQDKKRPAGRRPEDVRDEVHPHQDELLDEGVEETFPASDPVSVKRIT
jgi:hypothetical protein